MQIAKIEDGNITVADHREMFPNTSFPYSGPSAEWLASNGCAPVTVWKEHDRNTHKLEQVKPYLDGGVAYTVQVAPLNAEELAQRVAEWQDGIVAATQQRLDAFARTRNYEGILSACTYAASAVAKFAAEGQCAVAARDATWSKLHEILADVANGKRPAHVAFDDIEAELPTLNWPA